MCWILLSESERERKKIYIYIFTLICAANILTIIDTKYLIFITRLSYVNVKDFLTDNAVTATGTLYMDICVSLCDLNVNVYGVVLSIFDETYAKPVK